jgi:hypothetical protein
MEGRMERKERDDPGKEILRFEYDGCLIIHKHFTSTLPYGLPYYSEWQIHKINPDGMLTYIGCESNEGRAKRAVDYLVNDPIRGAKWRRDAQD